MNHFVHPDLLFGIPLVLALLILLYWHSQKKAEQKLNKLVSFKLKGQLLPAHSPRRKITKFCLFIGAIVFLLFALAGPQWGTSQRSITPKGIDILIAVDLSKSMLARDVRPNRLERVKLSLTNLLPKVKGDRLGLIAFSGSSFLQCPLTLDHQAFAKSLDELKVGLIPRMGTNLALPIQEAARSFSKDDTDKFLILISDGEDLEGQGLAQAKLAAEQGIRIYTIGIGSKEGSFIVTDPVGQDPQNFLTNRQGERIVTKLDEDSLRYIAQSTGGQFLSIGPTGEGISYVFSELQAFGQKKMHEQFSTTLPINRYQFFVLIGLLFLFSEFLTPSAKQKPMGVSFNSMLVLILFFTGCWKSENIRQAEEAIEKGEPSKAAELYLQEIENLESKEDENLGTLYLNAGLALFGAKEYQTAEEYLNRALHRSTDSPNIQSTALNTLGNIYYAKANSFLDRQDVSQARSTWEKAREYYSSALSIDGNQLAKDNLDSLNQQIQERIESLVSKIKGLVWRDINGNGKVDPEEPPLKSIVYWDRNNNGEHNQSEEPFIETDSQGRFAFEWISATYPTSLKIGSLLADDNQTKKDLLIPLFPAPPPPMNPQMVKNHALSLDQSGEHIIAIPWRGAPVLKGKVWNDTDGDSILDANESGSSAATIFLDENGNFQIDENETSFKPGEDGSFSHAVPPGQFSVCILPDNEEANITRPIDDHKAYLTWVDFEQNSQALLFGLQEDGNGSNSSDPNQDQANQSSPPESSEESNEDENQPAQSSEEVNALYERLLQETESKSEPLQLEPQFSEPVNAGRDY